MSNIEVGEYVRTRDGRIYQVNSDNDEWVLSDIFYKVIVKHSKNIIDLIEVGDIVNYTLWKEPDVFFFDNLVERLSTSIALGEFKRLLDEEIITLNGIVTKEMFKEMEYRVDE